MRHCLPGVNVLLMYGPIHTQLNFDTTNALVVPKNVVVRKICYMDVSLNGPDGMGSAKYVHLMEGFVISRFIILLFTCSSLFTMLSAEHSVVVITASRGVSASRTTSFHSKLQQFSG